ncbi:hypothetical protein HPB50_026490 [Hyalomma asiaticum]|uniref:Uncharacterized protein n=1 Tax=Hyalomma asiaticum TaxID=266040 RepID=A0ACB7SRQ0_HYAAI|nr:hypothetical protein HPB50_026490 [Hyalomma asiaticum]
MLHQIGVEEAHIVGEERALPCAPLSPSWSEVPIRAALQGGQMSDITRSLSAAGAIERRAGIEADADADSVTGRRCYASAAPSGSHLRQRNAITQMTAALISSRYLLAREDGRRPSRASATVTVARYGYPL